MIVAVSCDRRSLGPKPNSHRVRPARAEVFVKECVVDKLRDAGLQAILLPPEGSAELVDWVMQYCDGVVITGGAFDIDPKWYGQEKQSRLDAIDEGRTLLEMQLAQKAIERNVPLLGLCGGMQVLAVVAGGTLIQDIGTTHPEALEHEQPTNPSTAWHSVQLTSIRWQEWFGTSNIQVNSTHHQAVDKLGRCIAVGKAPDGIVEAIEISDLAFCVGVQWHPELVDNKLFEAFGQAIRENA
jgi:putative glutamine amidotransferase